MHIPEHSVSAAELTEMRLHAGNLPYDSCLWKTIKQVTWFLKITDGAITERFSSKFFPKATIGLHVFPEHLNYVATTLHFEFRIFKINTDSAAIPSKIFFCVKLKI